MISLKDRIFTNLHGKFGVDLKSSKERGDWKFSLSFLTKGRKWIISEIKDSGLRGRGGAGFLTGVKWSFMPETKSSGKVSYMVINADESEPGACKDRDIMRYEPHKLLEGCLISSFAVGARYCYIYIRGEFYQEAVILQNAIDEAYKANYLGQNIFNLGIDIDVYIHKGAGAYICGEESALLESIEGRKGQPRLKPPFPAISGLYSCPTNINNVESIAVVSSILRRGANWFNSLGSKNNAGSKIFSISGHVNNPCNVEEELGVPLKVLINEYAGGVIGGWDNLKAVIPGGASFQVLPKEICEYVKMDFDSLKKVGSGLGVGGIIVMNKSVDIVAAITRISKFFMHESCGKCSPCREGTGWMWRIMQKISSGQSQAQDHDIDKLLEISYQVGGNAICGLSDAASWPIQGLIKHFREDMEKKIRY